MHLNVINFDYKDTDQRDRLPDRSDHRDCPGDRAEGQVD